MKFCGNVIAPKFNSFSFYQNTQFWFCSRVAYHQSMTIFLGFIEGTQFFQRYFFVSLWRMLLVALGHLEIEGSPKAATSTLKNAECRIQTVSCGHSICEKLCPLDSPPISAFASFIISATYRSPTFDRRSLLSSDLSRPPLLIIVPTIGPVVLVEEDRSMSSPSNVPF